MLMLRKSEGNREIFSLLPSGTGRKREGDAKRETGFAVRRESAIVKTSYTPALANRFANALLKKHFNRTLRPA